MQVTTDKPKIKYLSVKEIAETYGYSEETIRRYIREGQLKAIRFGGSYRIAESALQEFIDRQNKK